MFSWRALLTCLLVSWHTFLTYFLNIFKRILACLLSILHVNLFHSLIQYCTWVFLLIDPILHVNLLIRWSYSARAFFGFWSNTARKPSHSLIQFRTYFFHFLIQCCTKAFPFSDPILHVGILIGCSNDARISDPRLHVLQRLPISLSLKSFA